LEQLRARAAGGQTEPGREAILTLLLEESRAEPSEGDGSLKRHWKASTRIRVRARNVLRRWAFAQTDPRLVWVDPLAPAGNFAMIAWTLAFLRAQRAHEPASVELTDDDLDDLWQTWLRAVCGTGERDGWLDQLDDAAKARALERLPDWLAEVVAALCWLVVRPLGRAYRERVVAFQPILAAALAKDLVDPTTWTARYLSQVTGYDILPQQIDQTILAAIDFIDDDIWCARMAEELGLSELKLEAPPGATRVQVRLDVRGIADPLLEPRLPHLVVAPTLPSMRWGRRVQLGLRMASCVYK